MICSKCLVICRDVCPVCGSRKRLCSLSAENQVLLMTIPSSKSIFIEPILFENQIHFIRKGTVGGVLSMFSGLGGEVFRYYVCYSEYDRAREVLECFFSNDDVIMRALHEFDGEVD